MKNHDEIMLIMKTIPRAENNKVNYKDKKCIISNAHYLLIYNNFILPLKWTSVGHLLLGSGQTPAASASRFILAEEHFSTKQKRWTNEFHQSGC